MQRIVHRDFFPKNTVCEVKESDFKVEKHEKYYLSWLTKVNVNSGKSC